jgi:hypothetical protein
VPIDKDHRGSPSFKFRSGITLILDKTGQVLYIIHKNIDDKNDGSENNRLIRQRNYLLMRESDLAMAPYVDTKAIYDRVSKEADFSMVHRGY